MNPYVEVVHESGAPISRTGLTELAEAVLESEGCNGALTIVVVGEDLMTDLNLRYRGAEGPTDVLSFTEMDHRDAWPAIGHDAKQRRGECSPLGEMVICPAVVRAYAEEDGVTPAYQLGWTVVHGTLHLLGYDHETDKGEMRSRETVLLELFADMLDGLIFPLGPQT